MKFNAAFKKWFGDSKVIDTKGNPLVVYHGTTHDFSTFDQDVSNIENFFGKAFYFSSSRSDVEHNYAGEGPDLTNRIESLADKIYTEMVQNDEPEYGSDDYILTREKAEKIARKKLSGAAPLTMACYLKIKNPLWIKPKGGTVFELEYEYEDNDPDKDIIGDSGTATDMRDAIDSVLSDWGINQRKIWTELSENGVDEINDLSAHSLDKALRKCEHLYEERDDDDNLSSSEIVRQIYERAGYDGIIQDAYAEFGQGKNRKAMTGVTPGTLYYICFKPNQIKSAIGNDGTYDDHDTDIRSNPR